MKGAELRAKRKRLKLTQAQFAKRLGLSRDYIGQLERDVAEISIRTATTVNALVGEAPGTSLFTTVVDWCDRIQNGRTIRTALDSVKDEVEELEDEVLAQKYPGEFKAGPDGIFGEAIDVLCSTIDIIRMERPNITAEQLEREVAAYADKKCLKWAEKYG